MASGVTSMQAQVNNDVPTVIYPNDSAVVNKIEEPHQETTDSLSTSSDDSKLSDLLSSWKTKPNVQKHHRNWNTWRPCSKKALWLSFIPGVGQIYNRKYWKLPIFYGGFVGSIYAWSWNNQMYHDYSRAYADITDDDPTTQSYNHFLHLGVTIDDSNKVLYQEVFKKRKDRYRRWRDLSIFATVAVYALSIVDAYVDASLSEFDISDNLSLRIAPTFIPDPSSGNPCSPFVSSTLGIRCSLTF